MSRKNRNEWQKYTRDLYKNIKKYFYFILRELYKKIFLFYFERIIYKNWKNIFYFISRELYTIIMHRDDTFIDLTQMLNERQTKKKCWVYSFVNFFRKIYKKIF